MTSPIFIINYSIRQNITYRETLHILKIMIIIAFFYLQVANSPSKPRFKAKLVQENSQKVDCNLKPKESVNTGKNLCRKSLIKYISFEVFSKSHVRGR